MGFAGAPTLSDFARDYLDWYQHEYPQSHERTYQILRDHLLPAFGDRPMGDITEEEAERWKRNRQAAIETIAKELRVLKAVLNKAVQWRVIPQNPVANVAPPRNKLDRPPPFYTADQLQELYRCSPYHHLTWRLYVLTGMRRDEGLNLRWRDVGERYIKVLSTNEAPTKSGRWRQIPIPEALRWALDLLRDRAEGDHVLPQVAPPSLSRAFVKCATRAGLEGSLHWLRHTYISHLVMAGTPIRTVQVLAGHSTVRTTERYAHVAPEHLEQAVAGLNL